MIQKSGSGSKGSATSSATNASGPHLRKALPLADSALLAGVETMALTSMLLVRVTGSQRAPQQHRQDDGEHDHFLECAGPERAEGLDHADRQRTDQRARITGQAADHAGHEALQANQEAGVVEDGGGRPDQEP